MNIGFIGAGKMGSALVKGIVKSGMVRPENVNVYDVDETKTDFLRKETGINVLNGNIGVVSASDIVIIAVVPGMVKHVLQPCKHLFNKDRILVSIAAGIPIKTFREIIGEEGKIIRTMPNRPAFVGEGMTLISYEGSVSEAEAGTVRKLFECVGKTEILDEKLMSEVIALTSSSPAYVFMFIEAMADAAVLTGIPRNLAYRLAAQAVLGSAKMVLDTGQHPGELKDQICTPAGTTIEAVAALERNGFRRAVIDAMLECTRKAREIGKIYG